MLLDEEFDNFHIISHAGLLIKGKFWYNNDSVLNCYSLRCNILHNIEILKKNSLVLLNQCSDIVAYDEPGKFNRFTLVYIITSLVYGVRLHIYIQTSELKSVKSATSLFCSTNWSEREIWDLFGIFFFGHSDIRRILLDYGFKGHPIRKDFPLTGYLELSFIESSNSLAYTKVELLQEYKNFIFIHTKNNF